MTDKECTCDKHASIWNDEILHKVGCKNRKDEDS